MAKLGELVAEPIRTSVSLESHLEMIALEAGFVSNMADTAKNLLPDFRFKLIGLGNRIKELLDDGKDISDTLTRRQRKALEVIKQLDFLVYGVRMISIPEDFEGSFVDYSRELVKVCDEVMRDCNGFIQDYDDILSSFITNKNDKSIITRHDALFKKIKTERDDITKRLTHFFPRHVGKSKAKMTHVIKRFADLPELFSNTNQLTDKHKTIGLEQIKQSVDHCAQLLEIIIRSLQSGETTSVTPEAVQNIATGAYEVGKYIEVLSVFYFDVVVFLNCVNGMLEDFENM